MERYIIGFGHGVGADPNRYALCLAANFFHFPGQHEFALVRLNQHVQRSLISFTAYAPASKSGDKMILKTAAKARVSSRFGWVVAGGKLQNLADPTGYAPAAARAAWTNCPATSSPKACRSISPPRTGSSRVPLSSLHPAA